VLQLVLLEKECIIIGWMPSSFTSSRNQRAEKKTFQPEQFMDDEVK
jgi:hypothetical protein